VAIVGAPRCGTTSLADFLRRRPDVVFSTPKEPHYFAIHDLTAVHGGELADTVRQGYLDRFFPDYRHDARYLAEGSVSYLYGAERMEPVLELWPDARFIIAVRDPMKLVPSLHQRYLVTGDENEKSFERAWALVPERAAGRKVPRSCLDPRLLRYDLAGKLGEQVERFFAVVGRERCHVVVHDDLVANPAQVYAEMLAFLGLPHDGRTKFKQKRKAEGYRFGWLQRLLKRPPVATSVLAGEEFRRRVVSKPRRPPSVPVRKLMEARKALLRWNKAPAEPVRLSRRMQEELRAAFADDVAHLGRLLGRDLSHWLRVSDEAR
jgi:hypothetical protein